eukprot:CAMPEP_0203934546 /NCGR_PEP_ID=MMETSP0359-20131031/72490_1 /ASSEMBLY_ACC=CAM_ASM_000338 /TAXON_ID=268821 /ORGANISM="Scrippsiella Hangoei, Strain SHTV-5" /LENGTH=311 /DNA_ID=CAMNT_0050864275 /DNA_START=16 /DNA_END=951 /DNA_ORIENTATION=-
MMTSVTQDSRRFVAASSAFPAYVGSGHFASPLPRPEFAPPQYQHHEQDAVIEFGAIRRTDTDIIAEMLAKFDIPKSMAAVVAPQPEHATVGVACGSFHPPRGFEHLCLDALGSFHPPPGLEHQCLTSPKGYADEQVSTADEWSSESFRSCSTQPSSVENWEVMPIAPVDEAARRLGMTTLTVCNIPATCTQVMLVCEWCHTNFDFLYLPKGAAGQMNMGFALINFASEEDASTFKATWHKQRLIENMALEPLSISLAKIQGLRGNLLQLKTERDHGLHIGQREPTIVCDGQLVHLEEAIESLTKNGKEMSM